jgi:hypothetical protein
MSPADVGSAVGVGGLPRDNLACERSEGAHKVLKRALCHQHLAATDHVSTETRAWNGRKSMGR